jgi:hypothetical protein
MSSATTVKTGEKSYNPDFIKPHVKAGQSANALLASGLIQTQFWPWIQ